MRSYTSILKGSRGATHDWLPDTSKVDNSIKISYNNNQRSVRCKPNLLSPITFIATMGILTKSSQNSAPSSILSNGLSRRSDSKLTISSWNVAGLKSTLSSKSAVDYLSKSGIICLQETWSLSPTVLHGFYEFFQPASRPNSFGQPSGGFSIFIKHSCKITATPLYRNFSAGQILLISGL